MALLERRDNEILAIAFAVGYSDLTTFGRAFKTFGGVSPRTYRYSRIPVFGGAKRIPAMRAADSARDARAPLSATAPLPPRASNGSRLTRVNRPTTQQKPTTTTIDDSTTSNADIR